MYIQKFVINFTGMENVCLTIYKYEHNTQHFCRGCGSWFVLRRYVGWFLPNSLICSQPMGTIQPWFDKLSCIPIQFLLTQETCCSSVHYVIYIWSTVKPLLTLKQVLLINESQLHRLARQPLKINLHYSHFLLSCFCFWQSWGLNPRPSTRWASALPLSYFLKLSLLSKAY